MKTVKQYIDAATRKAGGLNALGRAIGFASSTASQYHTGKRTPSDDEAWKLAEYLGVDPKEIIAAAALERAKTPEERTRWTERLGKMKAATATGVKVMIAGAAFGGFLAAGITTSQESFGANMDPLNESQVLDNNINYTTHPRPFRLGRAAKRPKSFESLHRAPSGCRCCSRSASTV